MAETRPVAQRSLRRRQEIEYADRVDHERLATRPRTFRSDAGPHNYPYAQKIHDDEAPITEA